MKKLALLMGIALGSLNSFSQETRQPKPIVKDTVLELNEVVLSANVIFGSKFVAKTEPDLHITFHLQRFKSLTIPI